MALNPSITDSELSDKIKAVNLNSNGLSDGNSTNGGNGLEVDGFVFGESTSMKKNGALSKGFASTLTEKEAEIYSMSHKNRGHCVIFNHNVFDPVTQLGQRNGTNKDRDAVSHLFKDLGFDVVVENNLSVKSIQEKLENYAYEIDHKDNDSFVVVFMSHGEEGQLFGRDTNFKADILYNHFTADNCPSLANKPKLFFIQACRGDQVDSGITMVKTGSSDETDAGPQLFYKIPVHADFLISWSTVPGHFSWRNTTNGSWFIQSLVRTIYKKCLDEDLLSIMTMVNHHLINAFESNCPSSPSMDKKKQTAYVVSTLTRKVMLRPLSQNKK